jgi:hypothetical protein
MRRYPRSTLFTSALCLIGIGCRDSTSSEQALPATTPEEAYRKFMIVNLAGEEAAIRPLVLDHPDSHLLWQGPYPADVAELLADQYRTMEITRVDSPDADDASRVLLQSSAAPIPIAAVNMDGVWKIDATPIIEFRKRAAKLERDEPAGPAE